MDKNWSYFGVDFFVFSSVLSGSGSLVDVVGEEKMLGR